MGRILAFDYGKKRVGIAVSDPLKMIANTLETIPTNRIFEFVNEYCQREQVEAFVLGYPHNPGHDANEVESAVMKFQAELMKRFPEKTVHLVDERFTSRMAQQTLRTSGVTRKEVHRKENVDAIAANLILQTYLEMSSR